jgi:hypothetical protein
MVMILTLVTATSIVMLMFLVMNIIFISQSSNIMTRVIDLPKTTIISNTIWMAIFIYISILLLCIREVLVKPKLPILYYNSAFSKNSTF